MFGGNVLYSTVVSLDWDPAADDDISAWVAPQTVEIASATWTQTNAVGGSTANWFDLALYNGGTAGTALTAISGTIGGTGGWSALTPVSFTISNGTVTAGELVKVRYNEEGTGTFQHGVLTLNYRIGLA